ncbi:YciI family protein [Pseudonocardia aurantiaca]|uniref:YciI family protein n=1 Tax=Pseudonocardia aurantiaca TaxID=75290 RepID=A0ABW4FV84_9PSEU
MRVMVLMKPGPAAEAGEMPSEELFTAMGRYNEELVAAGVLVGGDGLHPSAQGARVRYSRGKQTVIDGPFAEAKELVAGYWIWQVESLEEAVEWAKRCPHGPVEGEAELEIRRIFEVEDFAPIATPEILEHNERLRAQVAEQQAGNA